MSHVRHSLQFLFLYVHLPLLFEVSSKYNLNDYGIALKNDLNSLKITTVLMSYGDWQIISSSILAVIRAHFWLFRIPIEKGPFCTGSCGREFKRRQKLDVIFLEFQQFRYLTYKKKYWIISGSDRSPNGNQFVTIIVESSSQRGQKKTKVRETLHEMTALLRTKNWKVEPATIFRNDCTELDHSRITVNVEKMIKCIWTFFLVKLQCSNEANLTVDNIIKQWLWTRTSHRIHSRRILDI